VYKKAWEFYAQLEKKIEDFSTCRIRDLDPFALNWGQEAYQHTSVQYHARRYQIPALTLETSYHFDSRNRLLDPQEWRRIGNRTWETVADCFLEQTQFATSSFSAVASGEIVWRYWEMISLNERCTLEEDGRKLAIHSSDDGNAFVTFRTHILPARKAAVAIQYASEDAYLRCEVITYFYKDRIVFERFNTQYLSLIPGTYTFHPAHDTYPDNCSSYRIAIKVNNLVGSLSLEIRGTDDGW
jgi:hypothetical protein